MTTILRNRDGAVKQCVPIFEVNLSALNETDGTLVMVQQARPSPFARSQLPKRAKGKEELGMLPIVMSLAMMLNSSFAPILHCLEEVQYWCDSPSFAPT